MAKKNFKDFENSKEETTNDTKYNTDANGTKKNRGQSGKVSEIHVTDQTIQEILLRYQQGLIESNSKQLHLRLVERLIFLGITLSAITYILFLA